MNTNILNQLESELKEVKRKKRNDLNFYDFSKCVYYDNQILEIEKKIDKIKDTQGIETQLNKKEN